MASKLVNVIADFSTTLVSKVAIGDTTATLNSGLDSDGVQLPTGTYGFTINREGASKEYFTATVTGAALTNIQTVARGTGVGTSGFARSHRKGAEIIISDWVVLKRMMDVLTGGTKFDSASILGYDGAPSLSGVNDFATLQYVLDHVNGGAVSINQTNLAGTAGETFSAGQPVYLKASDSRWYKALGNNTLFNSLTNTQLGIAIGSGSSGVAITGGVAIFGLVSGLSGLTANNVYYISDAGALSTTAGTYSIQVGWALTTTTLIFNPEGLAVLNTLLTPDKIYTSDTDQTQTTQDSTAKVGEADATGKNNILAQSFIPAKTKIRGVKLYKSADSGSFTGTVTVSLQADSAGSPSGSSLATVTISNATWLALATGEFQAIFGSEYASQTIGNLYWIVVQTSTSDNTNHPNLGISVNGGYSSGSSKFKNTTDGWTAIANIDFYFKTLQGISSQLAYISTVPTVQVFTTPGANTYTKPAGVKYIEVELVDGGNGGDGTGAGSAGSASSFGTLVTSSVGDVKISGQPAGQPAFYQTNNYVGGKGGDSMLGFGGFNKSGAGSASTGYGAGGAGGSETGQGHTGGKGGDYSRKLISGATVPTIVTVTVGTLGAKATGTNYGQQDGQNGIVIVKEYYY